MTSVARHEGGALPPGDLVLRPVSAFDFDLLALLHAGTFRESWDRPWSHQSFAEVMAMPGSFGLIAALQNPGQNPGQSTDGTAEPVGFGLTLASGEEVELLLLAVLPRWRRRGVARRLLLALLDQAQRGGARRALLEVASANAAAVACYAKLGFTACGRRRDYYSPGIDALIYERMLEEAGPNTQGG